MGPFLLGEREEPDPVELGGFEEAQQRVVILFGLAGIAEDERGPERGFRRALADRVDALEEAGAVAEAPHASQVGTRDVLEGEVEVRNARRDDRIEQLVGK